MYPLDGVHEVTVTFPAVVPVRGPVPVHCWSTVLVPNLNTFTVQVEGSVVTNAGLVRPERVKPTVISSVIDF